MKTTIVIIECHGEKPLAEIKVDAINFSAQLKEEIIYKGITYICQDGCGNANSEFYESITYIEKPSENTKYRVFKDDNPSAHDSEEAYKNSIVKMTWKELTDYFGEDFLKQCYVNENRHLNAKANGGFIALTDKDNPFVFKKFTLKE